MASADRDWQPLNSLFYLSNESFDLIMADLRNSSYHFLALNLQHALHVMELEVLHCAGGLDAIFWQLSLLQVAPYYVTSHNMYH